MHPMNRLWTILATGALLLAATGCEKALFPESSYRTQYERYDRLHGRYVPMEEVNVYGGSEPALRARLTPRRP